MPILRPDHLLEQADLLVERRISPVHRQADLKRAVSAAYYALFHTVLIACADHLIGRDQRETPLYALAYRRIEHAALRGLCADLSRQQVHPKYLPLLPPNGWGDDLPAMFKAITDLYEQRHLADYDPMFRVSVEDAREKVDLARAAVARFGKVSARRRAIFLTLLIFPPRQ